TGRMEASSSVDRALQPEAQRTEKPFVGIRDQLGPLYASAERPRVGRGQWRANHAPRNRSRPARASDCARETAFRCGLHAGVLPKTQNHPVAALQRESLSALRKALRPLLPSLQQFFSLLGGNFRKRRAAQRNEASELNSSRILFVPRRTERPRPGRIQISATRPDGMSAPCGP